MTSTAIDIKPDAHEALYNWGTDLGNLAKTKEGKEADELYQQAFDKFQKAIVCGASSYNLSCIYALKGEKENALKYLHTSLANLEIDVVFIENDEDWKDYFEDEDFIVLLNKYKNKAQPRSLTGRRGLFNQATLTAPVSTAISLYEYFFFLVYPK